MAADYHDRAPAKINLFLHIEGKRPDGYHSLSSLVSFASVGDDLSLDEANAASLSLSGPFAADIGDAADNLVLKAARAFAEAVPGARTGRFHLVKTLPVASGIGGGSSDAASALRLLARLNAIPLDDPGLMDVARSLGADVPVCLAAEPRMMRGIGHDLGPPLAARAMPALLVNPGIGVETRAVFSALGLVAGEDFVPPLTENPHATTIAVLKETRNDLEPPAIRLAPQIGEVLALLRAQEGVTFARMSGSGATCFALFTAEHHATRASEAMRSLMSQAWVASCTIAVPTA